ncbi:four helix bundle protein [Bacteroides sp.]|uniref:four helix bundle protein n=1 Tax=Bacteroides sp. TaxID=29523 RepID=UPI0023C76B1C|nr:four helix bundle protein [Bacteroides sp.]MDE5710230.1 four helix bundle protein [Bacteroides sp.]MDE5760049.1 four helix bundle protein [Bacteroides sp.]MDE6216573.1 four helix bundle protein [Bacteroides sp.]
MTQSFKDLLVWRKAHIFVLKVYEVSRSYPSEERFGLCSQFQRAAVSIPANIAEGYRKMSKADKLRLLNIAQGSLEECRYYIILSKDLNYINEKTYNELTKSIEDTSYLLNAYCKGITSKQWEE